MCTTQNISAFDTPLRLPRIDRILLSPKEAMPQHHGAKYEQEEQKLPKERELRSQGAVKKRSVHCTKAGGGGSNAATAALVRNGGLADGPLIGYGS